MPLFKKLLVSLILLLLLGTMGLYLFRQPLFNYYLNKKVEAFELKHKCEINYSSAALNGLTDVEIQDFTIIPPAKDTLLKINSAKISIFFKPLLFKNIRLKEVNLNGVNCRIVKLDTTNNFSFLLSKKNASNKTKSQGYSSSFNKLISLFFDLVPNHTIVNNFNLHFKTEKLNEAFNLPLLTIKNGNLIGSVHAKDKPAISWIFFGTFDQTNEIFDLSFQGKKENSLPFLQELVDLKFGFDTLNFSLDKRTSSVDSLTLKGKIEIKGLLAEHPKLDSNKLHINKGSIYYHSVIEPNAITLAPSTAILNDIFINLKGKYINDGYDKFGFETNMPFMPAQKLFNSLPTGLFSNFNGLEVGGEVTFNSSFHLDLAMIDSVKFDCELVGKNFKIFKYGETDFSKLNNPFLYTAYEKGKAVKSFRVGPEYPFFTSSSDVSPYLKNAILISEDGSFFWHKGFRAEAFRKALAENIRKGKFARGGSTISMQLVKNVFLSRRKTIARKVEEAIIVWLIEKNKISNKERMYEVYLNIIEWGPGIYGVGEASHFYFNKHPKDLDLAESIYMASIIPRPKGFKYSFDEQGNLKPHLAGYFNKLAELMEKKQIITSEQKQTLVPNVQLTGQARNIVVKDTTEVDDF